MANLLRVLIIEDSPDDALLLMREDTLLALVYDRGPGIPAINLPELALKRGYTTGVSLGMGYKAMISIADHVHLATGLDGTTVAIAMQLHTTQQPPVALAAIPDVW